MGITGLLGFLKDIQRPCHVKTFANQTLGVDGYVWLHRGTYTCAQELCLGQPTTRYVNYAIKQVRLLRHWGIEPYLVFDGGPLPSKRGTEQGRKRSREEGRERANRLLAEGKVDEARDAFNKAVDVTPEMAYQLIKALRLEKVRYVVAPYEADAQLRFLEMHGHIDGILTEDSDLLVYGAKNVVLKLDKDGMCVHIARADFGQVPDSGMAFWTDREFRQMAILSGCDYLDSIEGVGLKTANQLIRRHKTAEKAIRNVSLNRKKLTLPRNYLRNFRVAEHTFLHQTVYDPSTASLVPLHPLPPLGDKSRPTDDDLSGCGEMFDNDLARGVAEGRLCPTTYEPIKDLVPRANAAPTAAYRPSGTKSWASQRGKQAGKKAKPTVAVPRNQQTIANFFTSASVVSGPRSPTGLIPASCRTSFDLAIGPQVSADQVTRQGIARRARRRPQSRSVVSSQVQQILWQRPLQFVQTRDRRRQRQRQGQSDRRWSAAASCYRRAGRLEDRRGRVLGCRRQSRRRCH